LLFLTLMTTIGLTAQDWQTVVKKYGPAVGKIEIREKSALVATGSGFLISRDGRMLTNAHVVQEAARNPQRRIIIIFPQSALPDKEYQASIVKIAPARDMDLALLKVEGAFRTCCELAEGEEPAIMSDILVIGFPLGKSFKATPGNVQAYQDIEGVGHMLDLSASVDFGNSGGPVFGKDGRVVGIVTAKIYGFNFNLALPSGNIVDFIAGQDRKITVTVTTTPAGARVFLNGIYRGESPLTIDLFRRDYALLVEKDGYRPVEKTVSLKDTAAPDIKVALESVVDKTKTKVTITSTPAGARVLVDNVERGKSPVTIEAVKGSIIRIKLLLPWHRDFTAEAVLSDEETQVLHYTLK
jgi:S1-C subfamily serine protease